MLPCRASILGLVVLIFSVIAATLLVADGLPTDFTLRLDVQSLNEHSYRQFMYDLDQELGHLHGAFQIGGVTVLPPQPEGSQRPDRWFHLELEANGNKATVRIRGDNLYIVGYQKQNSQTWLEYQGKHFIPGSTSLGFGDKYSEMLKETTYGKVWEVPLAKTDLITAVGELAHSDEKQGRATALIVVAVMVCEARRLSDMADFFARNLDKHEVRVEKWQMNDLVWSWSDYSTDVLCYDQYGPAYIYKMKKIHGQTIQTVDALRSRLGLILKTSIFVGGRCKHRLPRGGLLADARTRVLEVMPTDAGLSRLLVPCLVILAIVLVLVVAVHIARSRRASKAKKA